MIRTSRWGLAKKLSFLARKYALLVKHTVLPFSLGASAVSFAGDVIFYDSKYGLADYQSMLTRPQRMMQLSGVKDVSVVVDCGANVGFFSKMIRDVFPDATIYCIEPVPKIFDCLRKNLSGDEHVRLFNVAVSDRPGRAQMAFDEQDSAVSRLAPAGTVEVTVTTLDDFVRDNGIDHIDVLKIDTETYEAHVLRGGGTVLTVTRYLFLEITLVDNPNYTLSSLMALLSTPDFDFQLRAFRNFADKGEGTMPIMDCLLENVRKDGD